MPARRLLTRLGYAFRGFPRDREPSPSICTGLAAGCLSYRVVTVSGNGTYTTPTGYTLPTTGTVTGTYQWVATYSGDGNNNGVASAKGIEPVVVSPANLLLSTTNIPSDVTLSDTPLPISTDSATLTGSYHATGTITFDLYGPDGVTIDFTDTQPANGDGTYITTFAPPTTAPPGFPITGTYNWVVSYSGDANNNGVVSSVGNEAVQVHAANPSLGTNSSPGRVTLSSGSSSILTDTATLTGGFSPDRDNRLRSLRSQWRGPRRYRDGHRQRERDLHHARRLHAPHDRDGDRHVPVGRHLQRRRQQ